MKHSRLLVVVVVLLLLLLCVTAAQAQTFWEALVPDETGAVLFVAPEVRGDDWLQVALSWTLWAPGPAVICATVLRPELPPGIGLDAGLAEQRVRFGVGYLNGQTWGLYVRGSF